MTICIEKVGKVVMNSDKPMDGMGFFPCFPTRQTQEESRSSFCFFFRCLTYFSQLTSGSMSFFNQISSDRGCYYHRATKITKALYQRQGRAMPGVLANSPFPKRKFRKIQRSTRS